MEQCLLHHFKLCDKYSYHNLFMHPLCQGEIKCIIQFVIALQLQLQKTGELKFCTPKVLIERNDFYSLYYCSSIQCSFITRLSFSLTRFLVRKKKFPLELTNCSPLNCNYNKIFQMKHFYN